MRWGFMSKRWVMRWWSLWWGNCYIFWCIIWVMSKWCCRWMVGLCWCEWCWGILRNGWVYFVDVVVIVIFVVKCVGVFVYCLVKLWRLLMKVRFCVVCRGCFMGCFVWWGFFVCIFFCGGRSWDVCFVWRRVVVVIFVCIVVVGVVCFVKSIGSFRVWDWIFC